MKMQKASKFEEVEAESNAFAGREGESPLDLYRRITSLAVRMLDHGAREVDDGWMKRKFMQAILPFRRHTTMSVRERSDFHTMSSNAVVNEFVALEVLEKTADDAHARSQRLGSPNVALKAKASLNDEYCVEEVDEEEDLRTNE